MVVVAGQDIAVTRPGLPHLVVAGTSLDNHPARAANGRCRTEGSGCVGTDERCRNRVAGGVNAIEPHGPLELVHRYAFDDVAW